MMAIRLDTAAKFVCERSEWSISNLPLQKIIYLSQVEYAGKYGGRLVDTGFEAWGYGPVSPTLYHKVKMFGADPVEDVFFDALRLKEQSNRRAVLEAVCDKYLNARPGKLVNITHWDHGAWAKKYEHGQRNIRITDDDIAEEYRNRNMYRSEWRAISAGC